MSNQKGFTLIELLAGLLLFSIVSVAAVSLTVQAMHNNTNAEVSNSLRNDATYVTQVMRTAYENGTLNGVCAEGNTLSSSDSSKDNINLVLTDNNILEDVKFSYEGSDPSKPNCFNSQSEVKNLQVNFTISHENGEDEIETFDVDTAFSKPRASDLSVSLTKEEGSEIIKKCEALESQLINKNMNEDQFTNGLKFQGDTTSSLGQFDKNNHRSVRVKDGKMTITRGTSINDIPFKVDHSLKVNGSLNIYNNANTDIGKETNIQDSLAIFRTSSLETSLLNVGNSLTLEEQSVLMVHGDLNTGKGTFKSTNYSCIGGNSTFEGDTLFQEKTSFLTGGSLKVPNLTLTGSTNVSIGTDATITGNYHFQGINSLLDIGGNLTVNGKVTSYDGVTNVHGDVKIWGGIAIPSGAKLISDGDIYIKGKITPDWGGGTICAKGDIRMDQPYTGHEVSIQPNNQKCQK
jgi:prepilin-type N-terminal cleavage/methylation domain-containing protein